MQLNIYHKAKYFPFIVGLLIFVGCQPLTVIHTTSEKIETNNVELQSNDIEKLVSSYKSELDELMEVEVATLAGDLILEQPESNLGNHIAEIVYWQAEQSLNIPIDFAITNIGGLRVPSVSSGPLKVKDAYQIMPFDNYVVAMTLSGKTVRELANKMAGYKGWPVFKMTYEIKDKEAINIKINGLPLDDNKDYTVCITDYLANGGDNLSFLKEIPYINTNVYLRDAIVSFWKEQTKQNKVIRVVKDGRVKWADE